MLCYIQMTEKEPVQPIVNVYITIPEKTPIEDVEIKIDDEPEPVEHIQVKPWTQADAELLAKMAYGESMNVPVYNSAYGERSNAYQNACTMWTVLNRVDAGWGTVKEVVTAKNQFVGYRESNPVDPDLLNLAYEILGDWSCEADRLRTLPSDYLYFRGDGRYNYFRKQDGTQYDWSLSDPFV